MRTNDEIFASISESGVITESDLSLLKRRSNKAQKDLFNYSLIDGINGGYGIPVTEEQGEKGLKWLKRFLNRGIYGYREIEIIKTATAKDFCFRGFYNAGNAQIKFFMPVYELNGMEYVPMSEPYICG